MVRLACVQYQLSEIASYDEFAAKVSTQVTTAASQQALVADLVRISDLRVKGISPVTVRLGKVCITTPGACT